MATDVARRDTDHNVTLPQREAGVEAGQVPNRLVINIRQTGTLIVNGRVMTEPELRQLVTEFVSVHPGKPAVIRADAKVPYQAVMRVFGMCRGAGIRNVDLPVLEPGDQ